MNSRHAPGTCTKIGFLGFALLFAANVRAAGPYSMRRLSEREIVETYTQVLLDASHYADRDWKVAPFDSSAGFWGDGVSSGNEGIRTIADMVLTDATLLKYDNTLGENDRRDLLAKANAGLRYIVSTHRTGMQKCADGKPWGATPKFGGESWQSGMWTGSMACGAWLIWDKLDPELQKEIERVVAWEDDILAARKPPNNLWLDTKAEENAWEVPALVLGEVMFPKNPHAQAWHEGAIRYIMNTLCTEEDTHDATVIDGRPVKDWVGGANVQPDYTLENHNILHPSYIACSAYLMGQAAIYYRYANKPMPQAVDYHLLDTWKMFEGIIMPWGESVFPQGMDWELHGTPIINLYAQLATRKQDGLAARMEQCALQYMAAWQRKSDGNLAPPGSPLGIARHAINAEQLSYCLLSHKVFGPAAKPMSERQAAEQEAAVRDYPYVQIVAQRTLSKFASFSWKNRIMGLLMPIGSGHENDPFFTVPITNGFVGSFQLAPRGKSAVKVMDHSWRKNANGFETTGAVLTNGGKLKQTLRMVSIGNQTVVYEDHVIAMADVTVRRELGMPIGIENDAVSGGVREVFSENGKIKFDWQKPQPLVALTGKWANVDGRVGIIMIRSAGLAYTQASSYTRGISVYTDMLYGSYSHQPRKFKAGDEVAHRVAIFFTEVSPKQTADLAKLCRIEQTPSGQKLHFKQPSGGEADVPLF